MIKPTFRRRNIIIIVRKTYTHNNALLFLSYYIIDRFTVDTGNFITAMRLFEGSPIWSSFVRDDVKGNHTSRHEYVHKYMCGDDPDSVTSDAPMKYFGTIKLGLSVLVIAAAMM
jgi:hypothetical protein